jgi:hypothetical protein
MQICYRDNILDAAQTDWMECLRRAPYARQQGP